MSYPRYIQTLIVEDEPAPTQNYRRLFDEFAKEEDVAPPVFVQSYQDAAVQLGSNAIFHLAIIDLGLPQTTHETAQPGIDPGIDLVQRAARREGYPIPALLVISGRLGLGQANLSGLRELLQKEFWYGQMVPKGIEEPEAIEKALLKARVYCDVGIHLRDAAGKLCPTLSPREDDLLRRCVLGIPQCIGLDLEWWGKYLRISSIKGRATAEKKILMGRFLFKEGLESSRPSFFKFEEAETAAPTHKAAALMVHKLAHLKLIAPTPIQSSNRSLLVTQQVGGSSDRLISLADFLEDSSKTAFQSIPRVAADVIGQLESLGTVVENQFPISELLLQWYDITKVEAAHLTHGGDKEAKPLRLLQHLRANKKLVWARRQTCTHGDLNATNIALEAVEDGYRAYIFDAEGIHADVATRDLAMLETTLLLHQLILPPDKSLVEECRTIYTAGFEIPELAPNKTLPLVQNTLKLIQEIRQHVLQQNQIQPYVLMVFDCSMLQLGGLAVQSRGNKIANPQDAVRLADLTASWLASVAPELIA